MSTEIILSPRPFARYSGRLLLLPLLPHRPPLKPLPAEVWSKIFAQVLTADISVSDSAQTVKSWPSLLLICNCFKEIAMPLFYSHVQLRTSRSLGKFVSCLHTADQKWDSIRRIPYSVPGRWVQALDLTGLPSTLECHEAFVVDSLLTQLFPLLPFLARLSLCAGLCLSRRALSALTNRDGNSHLRVLEGLNYEPSFISPFETADDPVVQLLAACKCLERLEIIGVGLGPFDVEFLDHPHDSQLPLQNVKLDLQHLHTLTLLSMPSSSLMIALLSVSLPSLRKLIITPYDDLPYPTSLVSQFLDCHGSPLLSLLFFTPKSWPTRLRPSPPNVLYTSPNLRHLSLECPLPTLILPTRESSHSPLPLEILSIPRPNSDFWRTLEKLLPQLPSLKVVRTRDVRWLRRGMTLRAQEAGVQGEMRDWRRRLARRGIRFLDGDWKETP
ncbi:hypothetical protein BJ138DRAFT_1143166 [Hygrophoropsis aurantiaca]|uniref:Uncharacterized protein n=1 Tax=Hygrophoropsis aurantiaca TaxID=72124 RepID=A0ACB8AP16_9AGAM|nr:hypothetical protein BJ138DRAFT_1143166 [Hygrophoropsis aurantiaca]